MRAYHDTVCSLPGKRTTHVRAGVISPGGSAAEAAAWPREMSAPSSADSAGSTRRCLPELSPGVRRMLTLVGSECSSFERGREQMKLLAGLEVTTKAVERTTESIGADIAEREQGTIQQALQRELPIAVGQAIPVMYVQMDGTGVPMVSKELQGRKGKGSNGRAHTREVKLGCVFTQTTADAEGWPVRDEDSTTYTGAIETAEEFSRRLYTEAQQRGWDRAQKKVVMGDGWGISWARVSASPSTPD